jgi:hypothetical protein
MYLDELPIRHSVNAPQIGAVDEKLDIMHEMRLGHVGNLAPVCSGRSQERAM